MRGIFTRAGLAIMWLSHYLPLGLQARLGRGLGALLYPFARERREVVLTNLRLCFPELDESARETLAREHFALFGRSFIERGLTFWASERRLRRLVRVQGLDHLHALVGRPVILFAPHFVCMDLAWARLSMEMPMAGIYSRQKNPVFDAALQRARARFNTPVTLSRQDGVLRAVRTVREGKPFYYLPDLDYGPRDSIFVPFFGVPAATITGLSRLSRLTGATVLTVVTRMLPGAEGYVVEIGEAWPDWPGASVEEDTRRMNASLEAAIRVMPEQYYWLHKRFKTRPPGDPKLY
ncbi:MAG: lipid A biosynthesis acyltransferase [Rhodocyclaceae bacterium]|nr:lipid A biosynthesis acyltransferase [Rhodocyclaceae bacterium]MBX3670062.1 lipid A biosynthesis acyltransferase [Rhodocyclaceae bacterium]